MFRSRDEPMHDLGRGSGCRPLLPAAAKVLVLAALSWLAGCQTSFRAALPEASERRASTVLTRQIVCDSSAALAHRPLHSAGELLYECAEHLCATTQGGIGKRLLMRLHGAPPPLCPVRSTLDPAALEEELAAQTGQPLQPAYLKLLPDGAEALAELERLIAQATCRIDIIMFLWEDDPIGQMIAGWVAARASRHLPVRVLVDGGGNLIFDRPDDARTIEVNHTVADLARRPNVQLVRIHNPFARFDHRKVVLVDGRVAWTGGRNFTEQAFFQQRDLSVTVTGPLVDLMQERFECFWREQGGAPAPSAAPPPSWLESSANAWARLAVTEPCNRDLEKTLYRAVDAAQHHVYMENVYFTDSRLVYKLAQARRRGADVRVIFTLDSSTEITNHANRVTANRFIKAGVRVYLCPIMTHLKAAAVDGCWAYTGSGNFDSLSLRHNREMGFAIGSGSAIQELERCVFAAGFRPEWELTRPLPLTLRDYAAEWLSSLYL
jgi:cardiolipin synthase